MHRLGAFYSSHIDCTVVKVIDLLKWNNLHNDSIPNECNVSQSKQSLTSHREWTVQGFQPVKAVQPSHAFCIQKSEIRLKRQMRKVVLTSYLETRVSRDEYVLVSDVSVSRRVLEHLISLYTGVLVLSRSCLGLGVECIVSFMRVVEYKLIHFSNHFYSRRTAFLRPVIMSLLYNTHLEISSPFPVEYLCRNCFVCIVSSIFSAMCIDVCVAFLCTRVSQQRTLQCWPHCPKNPAKQLKRKYKLNKLCMGGQAGLRGHSNFNSTLDNTTGNVENSWVGHFHIYSEIPMTYVGLH